MPGKKKRKKDKKGPDKKAPASYRDAGTGRFVTKKYAKQHKKTTVKETSKPLARG